MIKTVLQGALVLFLVALVSVLLVTYVYVSTTDKIEYAKLQKQREAIISMIPNIQKCILIEKPENTWKNVSAEKVYIIKTSDGKYMVGLLESSEGYGGKVKFIVIIGDGEVSNLYPFDLSSETPGLGLNAKEPKWYTNFIGIEEGLVPQKREDFKKIKEGFDALTGATITSMAVAKDLKKAFSDAKIILEELREGLMEELVNKGVGVWLVK